METYTTKIDEIESKVEEYGEMIAQNIELVEENEKLKTELKETQKLVKDLEDKVVAINDVVTEKEEIQEEKDKVSQVTTVAKASTNATNKSVSQPKVVDTKPENKETKEPEKVKEVIVAKETSPEPSRGSVGRDTSKINFGNITQKSGLTADEFDKIIAQAMSEKNKPSSKLLGTGAYLVQMENTYNVNGFFALGVSSYESGWGTRHKNNNLFGFQSGSMGFGNYGDSIIYFGKLMRDSNYYFARGNTSVQSIAPVYCPPNASNWISNVNWMMGYYKTVADKVLE